MQKMEVFSLKRQPEKRAVYSEIRSEGEGDEKKVAGAGIVYNKWEEFWPGYKERIMKGAVQIADEVKSFFNHEPSMVLSTTESNPPLELKDGDKAFEYVSPIPPTTYGKDLEINLARKNVKGSSFSFFVPEDGDKRWREDGVVYREIRKLTLLEVGPVTNPAYLKTSAGLRSAEDVYKEFLAAESQEDEVARKVEAKRKAGQEAEMRERDLQILDAEVS